MWNVSGRSGAGLPQAAAPGPGGLAPASGAHAVELRAALVRLRRVTGVPVAFGGLLTGPTETAWMGSPLLERS
ncbi:hypothetical protein OG897_17995 [Streptomyces sp. NBC_00237]|uniref:hypothetical protein n=1 Tax=Streptomyces sp. NBC_00237 TaxID=2975687 RepID=UPI0022550712|nr:hypothetical protein [Streptomyces sp. NBC_00237]MCX5203330.1 hypothetical protein [Streptomyces sp. NBC_00237]